MWSPRLKREIQQTGKVQRRFTKRSNGLNTLDLSNDERLKPSTGYPNVGVMWTATWFNVYCYKIISGTVAVHCNLKQETQLSPRYRAMRRVSWNLAGCHATVQKLLVRQVLNKSKLWSWRVKVGWCVINMCTQPWRVRVAFIVLKVSQTNRRRLSCVYITCIPTTCCGEIF